ncbi:MAG: hypothetical protein ACRDL5_07415, partial [Solirubrobacteraceae bacterium]
MALITALISRGIPPLDANSEPSSVTEVKAPPLDSSGRGAAPYERVAEADGPNFTPAVLTRHHVAQLLKRLIELALFD